MQGHQNAAYWLAFLMIFPALCGCMDNNTNEKFELEFSVDNLVGGELQTLRITSSTSMSVLVPYLILNPETNYF